MPSSRRFQPRHPSLALLPTNTIETQPHSKMVRAPSYTGIVAAWKRRPVPDQGLGSPSSEAQPRRPRTSSTYIPTASTRVPEPVWACLGVARVCTKLFVVASSAASSTATWHVRSQELSSVPAANRYVTTTSHPIEGPPPRCRGEKTESLAWETSFRSSKMANVD